MNAKHNYQLVLGLLFLLLSGITASAGTDDPFATLDLAPPSVVGSTQPLKPGQEPCTTETLKGPLTLSDVVERALCNNPQTREAWANARYQAALVGVSQAAYWPTVDATGGVSLNSAKGTGSYSQENAGVSANYVLYDFGARDANIENARQVLAAANATQDATLQAVFLAAVQAYYQLLGTQAAVDAARESEKSNLESFNAASARYNAGVGTPADKLQAQTAYSQAVLTRVRADGDLRNAHGTLANAMGLDANAAVDIASAGMSMPPATFEQDVGKLIEEARKHRPDLAAAEAQIKAAEAGVASARAAGRPTVSVTTGLNFSDTSIAPSSRNGALGLQVSVPIFTGYENTYRIRAAQEQVGIKAAQREKLSQQIALDVWKAYQGVSTETQSVRTSQYLLASAEQSERVALGRYKAGVGNILDVLTAQSALASARQQRIQALYNWHVAKAALAQALGQMDMAALTETTTKTGNQ